MKDEDYSKYLKLKEKQSKDEKLIIESLPDKYKEEARITADKQTLFNCQQLKDSTNCPISAPVKSF